MKPTLSLLKKKTQQNAARGCSPRRLVLPLLLIGGVVSLVALALSQQVKPPPQLELNQTPSYLKLRKISSELVQVASLHTSRRDEMCRELNKPLAEAWRGKLPKRLFVTAAVGYNFEKMRLLTNSFLHVANGVSNATERMGLIVFVNNVPVDWPIADDRIFFVRRAVDAADMGFEQSPVRTRFTQYKCFIAALGLQNDTRIFTLDARDSVLQRNPFVYPDDGRLRFFYESGFIKDVLVNKRWLQSCSSPEFAEYYSAMRVVNAGTMYGTADLLARYLEWFTAKLYSIAGCNDQGLHIYAIVSGDLRGVVNFYMEDNAWGGVLIAHGADKLVYLNEQDDICSKVTNEPYAIAHQYDRIAHVRYEVVRRFWLPPKGTRMIRELAPMPARWRAAAAALLGIVPRVRNPLIRNAVLTGDFAVTNVNVTGSVHLTSNDSLAANVLSGFGTA